MANKNRHQGAVIAEFVVIVGFVLVPLIIGLLFIGKYIDTAQKNGSCWLGIEIYLKVYSVE